MASRPTETETRTIGPHDESGFAPADVLKEAEKGDEIYLEMDFYDLPFESVKGTVANVIEQPDDDERMVRKTIQIESTGQNEMVNLGLKYDTMSAYVSLRERVRFVKRSEDDYVFGELDDLSMCELTREVGE
jgi:hypothetical protein